MTDLLPVEPYLRRQGALWPAVLVRTALAGVPLTVLLLLLLLAGGSVIGVIPAILMGVLAGLIFGVAWALRYVGSQRAMIRRVHRGEPPIVPPPPEGRPDYRLMCNYASSPLIHVPGHLYAAPDVLTFVPYVATIRRNEWPLVIPTGHPLEIDVVETGPTAGTRAMSSGPVRLLRIRTAGIKAVFMTPEPDAVAAKLRDYYRSASPST